jgi:TetR/AcrR family transcriptional regulator, tetracycline repressor protein
VAGATAFYYAVLHERFPTSARCVHSPVLGPWHWQAFYLAEAARPEPSAFSRDQCERIRDMQNRGSKARREVTNITDHGRGRGRQNKQVKQLPSNSRPKSALRPAHPRVGLSRELIVRAALALIDEGGLEGFTIRALSKRLGVQTRNIYWHVGPRNVLLAETVELVLSGITPPPARSWEDWLRTLFGNFRRAVANHPNIAAVIGAQMLASVSTDLNLIEQILNTLAQAGFEGDQLIGAYSAVISTMVGFVTLEFATAPLEQAAEWSDSMQARIAAIDKQSHPTLHRLRSRMTNRALVLRWKRGTEAPLDLGFEALTEIFIAGLAITAAKALGWRGESPSVGSTAVAGNRSKL